MTYTKELRQLASRYVGLTAWAPVPPQELIELLDRLEAAEEDVALKGRVIDALGAELNAVANERDALRAKIERMEKQEPVGEIQRANSTGNYINSVVWVPMAVGAKLYACPGAQNVPVEQDESVRKSWARFSNEFHRSPDAPYPGMSEAFEQHFSQSFTDRDWRAESGTWAAAWKAAKRHGAKGE